MNTLGVCDHSPEGMALSTSEQNETRTTITTTAMLSLPRRSFSDANGIKRRHSFRPARIRSFFRSCAFSADAFPQRLIRAHSPAHCNRQQAEVEEVHAEAEVVGTGVEAARAEAEVVGTEVDEVHADGEDQVDGRPKIPNICILYF